MKITVNKDNVKIEEFDVVHEGEHRVNKCSFSFSEEYTEELVKKAIFTSQNSSVEVAIINNECDIPTEILRARNIVLLGVYAYKVVDDKLDLRYSPCPDAFKVNSGSYIEDASESEEITATQFEQYMQAMNDGLNKVEESIKEMDSATSSVNDLVDEINQKLENGDFIGPPGSQGIPGKNGTDGVGITTITSGQSTVEEDKTITPITVNKTDGSSESFNVEAKNGLDGQNGINGQDGKDGKDGVNGQDGLTPTIGDNGNWYLGDTDTGKPSRGEVGPTPDLTDYVKNTDYAKDGKAGVVTPGNNLLVNQQTGMTYCRELSVEQYKDENVSGAAFVAKKTLQNIRDYFVGSSNPLITLNNTLDNLVRKNRVSDYIVSLKDALKYKVFEFLVHAKVKQESTTGKNLLFEIRNNYLVEVIDQEATTSSLEGFGNCKIGFKNSDGSTSINLDAGTYYISFDLKINSGNQSRALNLIAPSNRDGFEFISNHIPTANYQRYCASFTLNSSKEISDILIQKFYNDETCSFKIKNVMISSSSDYTYEPYTGGQPSPNPDYPQEITTLTFDKITRCGKNMTDISSTSYSQNCTVENGVATTIPLNNYGWANIGMTPIIIPAGTYYLSCDIRLKSGTANKMNYLRLTECDFTSVTNPAMTNDFQRYVFSNTVSQQKRYTTFGIQTDAATDAVLEIKNIMISKENSEYEPYQATEYTIDLQGNEMVEIPNGVKDELVVDKDGNVSLVKNIGKVILDGSVDFLPFTEGTDNGINKYGNVLFVNYRILNEKPAVKPYTKYPTVISNYFKETEENIWIGEKVAIDVDNYQLIFVVPQTLATTSDEFRAWLQEHNVTVYYQLATPEVIPLGNLTDLITTEEGINNFFINGNLETTLEVLYARDSEKYLQQYIDDKLATLSQAIIEEG